MKTIAGTLWRPTNSGLRTAGLLFSQSEKRSTWRAIPRTARDALGSQMPAPSPVLHRFAGVPRWTALTRCRSASVEICGGFVRDGTTDL